MSTHRDSYSAEADAEHMRYCETDQAGPACRLRTELGKRMDDMEARVDAIEKSRAEERGASEAMAKSNVRTVQILAALSALSTIAGFVLSHWHR